MGLKMNVFDELFFFFFSFGKQFKTVHVNGRRLSSETSIGLAGAAPLLDSIRLPGPGSPAIVQSEPKMMFWRLTGQSWFALSVPPPLSSRPYQSSTFAQLDRPTGFRQ